MFLKQTIRRNPNLIKTAFELHRKGIVRPDSYVIDMDTLSRNASMIRKEADRYGFKLFFMLKQLGRNSVIAKELMKLQYDGAVAVDYKEAEVLMAAGIPIGNVGHLVQVPEAQMDRVISYRPEAVTVFSAEKIKSVDRAAGRLGVVQDILLRMAGDGDLIYSGQTAGFDVEETGALALFVKRECPHVRIAGVTSFPCYLYDGERGDILPSPNLETVLKAERILKASGYGCRIVNTPSATCVHTIGQMKRYGGNCGEPGHGLTGTTPMHAGQELEEEPCVVYVSEVSHNFRGRGYCYGGGHYRRSHVQGALVGEDWNHARMVEVIPPSDESIDYHFGLSEEGVIGAAVIMAFRYQIFVTRSDVVLVKGIREGRPELAGIFDSQGRRL